MKLTILICTHNRAQLLQKTLNSLNQAIRPDADEVDILVIPNNCSDTTHKLLSDYVEGCSQSRNLPLEWAAETKPGKSFALNHAISLLKSDVVAFVDDDHRVDSHYLTNICIAAKEYPTATFFCGRILPDWDGSEPAWLHDKGPYAIYPLPVPRFDYGLKPEIFTPGGPVPGGGNLFLRCDIFNRVGNFLTALGPHGHDLGGGEDSEFVKRALKSGEVLQYVPSVIQHHYVDAERLTLTYIIRKSFQRSFSVIRLNTSKSSKLPLYLWRKLFTYFWHTITSLYWPQTRFYLVRVAATLGEINAYRNHEK